MLDVKGLKVHFPVRSGGRKGTVKAVNGVSFFLDKGDTLGIVGESGSGKSTIGKAILRLVPVTEGHIQLEGDDIVGASAAVEAKLRRTVQVVFQDPHSALNPRMTILRAVAEPLILHSTLRGVALREKVAELLETVRLPQQFLYRYPHELSGGQKQRVCIARAIALNPELLILDEPTSALDVSVQAQILEFLKSLHADFNLTYLFISHNLAVIRAICHRVAVMYLGQIVEQGPTEDVFTNPRHPYTPGAAESRSHTGSRPTETNGRLARRHSEPGQFAAGMHVPHPLSTRRSGNLRSGRTARPPPPRRPSRELSSG